MDDNELLIIYENSYKEEFNSYFQMVNTITEKARDKEYAIQMGLGVLTFILEFRNSSDIEKEIMKTYEHMYKLGGLVTDIIREIPRIIERHKIVTHKWHETHKNEISVEFKKIWGIIPYRIKQFTSKSKIRIGSLFENISSEGEIASELGKQRALIDIVEQLKIKYIETVGLENFKENDSPQIPLETLINLKNALSNNDLAKFFRIVQAVFATLPYDMKITEGYFHSHIHLLLTFLDIKILSELETNKGRIDSVSESENYIHIIEFKQNDSSIAMDQIKSKEYYQRFLTTNKKIILVGVAVDTKERNIIDWQMETYKK